MASQHPRQDRISAAALKDQLQDLALAAGGCMKAKPSMAARARLRAALTRSLKALKSPINECPPPADPDGGAEIDNNLADPVRLVAQYVAAGGDWAALIAAITSRGRSGQTRREYLTPETSKSSQGDHHGPAVSL